jgi:ParB-like chromosome segregation protein Spo0J
MVMAAPQQASTARRKPRGLLDHVVWRPIGELKEFPGNPRRHPERQIAGLMKSIRRFWTNPILVDETGTILAGHGRWEAARRLGMTKVPTVTVSGLSDSVKRAVVIADNRLPEQAVWDFDLLRGHFQDLIKVDFDVELTGFSTGEIDLLIDGSTNSVTTDPADDLAGLDPKGPTISQLGDVWELGRHRLACGDAQRRETYQRLLSGELAEMMLTDPPYNVRIDGHAMGRGKVRPSRICYGRRRDVGGGV